MTLYLHCKNWWVTLTRHGFSELHLLLIAWDSTKSWLRQEVTRSWIGLSLICFLFCLLFYSAILENFPYYSPQHTNYSPIILIDSPHLLVHNENSHLHKAVLWLPCWCDIIIYCMVWNQVTTIYTTVSSLKGYLNRVHFSSSKEACHPDQLPLLKSHLIILK